MHWICYDTAFVGCRYAQMLEKKTVSQKFVGSYQLTRFWSTFCVLFWKFRHFNIKPGEKICRIFILVHVAKIMHHCRLAIITSTTTCAITWRKSNLGFLFLCSTASCDYCFPFRRHFTWPRQGQTAATQNQQSTKSCPRKVAITKTSLALSENTP